MGNQMNYPPFHRVNHRDAIWESAHNDWCLDMERSYIRRQHILENPPLVEKFISSPGVQKIVTDYLAKHPELVKEHMDEPGIVTRTLVTTTSYAHINRQGIVVAPGQIWESCDRRDRGLRKRVVEVEGGYCYFGGIAAGQMMPGCLSTVAAKDRPATRVAIRRLYPHSSGYRLVPAIEGGVAL